MRRGRDSVRRSKLAAASLAARPCLATPQVRGASSGFRIPTYSRNDEMQKTLLWERSMHVVAEREGFEPSEPFLVQHLSRMLHSTALAPLRASTIDIPFLAVDL